MPSRTRGRRVDGQPTVPAHAHAHGIVTASVAIGSALWVTISKLAVQALQFLAGLLLARLLLPADFGLLASIYVVSGLAVLFFELGFGTAIVQWASPSERDLSTVFWLNALGGVLFVVVLWAISPLIAALFGQPALIQLTPLVGLAYTAIVGVVHQALLQRAFRFGVIAVIDLVAAVAGLGTTLVLAVMGVGAASLAIGPIVTCALTSVLVMIAMPWRPRSFISIESLRRLWSFSSGVLGARVLQFAASNTDNLLLGRFAGPTQLGFYNRAFNLMLLPVYQVGGALGSVMFPMLASMQHDRPRMREGYLKALGGVALIAVPLLTGMAVTAPILVPVLWGNRWLPTVPLLALLAAAGIPRALAVTTTWLLQAQGRTRRLFASTLIEAALVVAGIVLGLGGGATGVATGVLIGEWVYLPIGLIVGLSPIGIRMQDLVRTLLPIALSAAFLVVGVLAVRPAARTLLDPLALGVEVAAGSAAYILGLVLLARPALVELRQRVARRAI